MTKGLAADDHDAGAPRGGGAAAAGGRRIVLVPSLVAVRPKQLPCDGRNSNAKGRCKKTEGSPKGQVETVCAATCEPGNAATKHRSTEDYDGEKYADSYLCECQSSTRYAWTIAGYGGQGGTTADLDGPGCTPAVCEAHVPTSSSMTRTVVAAIRSAASARRGANTGTSLTAATQC